MVRVGIAPSVRDSRHRDVAIDVVAFSLCAAVAAALSFLITVLVS